MRKVYQFLQGKSALFSAVLIVVGLWCFAVGFISTGISFLFQLCSLACLVILVFYWSLILAGRPGKLRGIAQIVKWFIVIGVVSLFILFLVVEYHIIQHHHGDQDIPESAQVVIVLGCKVNGEMPSQMLRFRLEAALNRLQDTPDSVAILCGGQGPEEDITEAQCMKRWLMEQGIDESRLIEEGRSTSTRENIRNAVEILKKDFPNKKEVVVVSTGFHLYRGKKICNMEGLTAYGIASRIPDLPFFHLNYYCREFASVLNMYLQEIIA